MSNLVNMDQNIGIFAVTLAIFHFIIFVISILINLLASEYASSGNKMEVDQKSRLFRRLTVLQCQIAQLDNLMRLPLAIKLLYYHKDILQVCICLPSTYVSTS